MTRAVTLAEIADTNTFIVDGTNNRVGIASTIPTATLDVNGVVKATSFTGNATGLTGTPDIAVRNITGVAATFTGVLTYEDVTNIDSIGIITARSGLRVVGGGLTVTGVSTFFSNIGINTDSPTENLSVNGNVVFGYDQLVGNPGSNIGVATVRGHHVNSNADYAELYFANSASSGGSTASIRAGREGDNVGNNLTFYTQPSGGSAGNGSERLRITSAGLVRVPDNGKFTAGAGDDLQIYHDSNNSVIDSNTGDLLIRNLGTTGDIYLDAKSGERGIKVIQDGAVELYNDNSKKLETSATGVTVTGTLNATTDVTINGKGAATTGKAIAMAMVFG